MAFETKQFEEYQENETSPKELQKIARIEINDKNEKPIDQQKFIENKFVRLDSVYKKESTRVTYNDKEPTSGGVLVTKRGNVGFHIEKDWAGGRNAEIAITDNKNTYKILLDLGDDGKYTMSVLQNGKSLPKQAANTIATKYIGML